MTEIFPHQGFDVSAIIFGKQGEMVILDNELLEIISGGDKPKKPNPTPTPPPKPGGDINEKCPGVPTDSLCNIINYIGC